MAAMLFTLRVPNAVGPPIHKGIDAAIEAPATRLSAQSKISLQRIATQAIIGG